MVSNALFVSNCLGSLSVRKGLIAKLALTVHSEWVFAVRIERPNAACLQTPTTPFKVDKHALRLHHHAFEYMKQVDLSIFIMIIKYRR